MIGQKVRENETIRPSQPNGPTMGVARMLIISVCSSAELYLIASRAALMALTIWLIAMAAIINRELLNT
jgi:hypothetical protein